jgi:chloride channel protein, CIC family
MRSRPSALRDFTVDRRVWLLTGVAMLIGAGVAGLAVLLLRAIALATNLFYYHRLSLALVGPAGSPLSPWIMPLVPVLGGLLVGFIAHYGSDKIRGHGIPEAIEAILLRGARVDPKVALLKPLSAAIAIGSGGPFGAEGPIIMTGGAFGSLVAQWLHLTDAERTTLLVAGAAAGMSATFAAPIAAILLAVELLLFEWRPRSLVPVATASVVGGALRSYASKHKQTVPDPRGTSTDLPDPSAIFPKNQDVRIHEQECDGEIFRPRSHGDLLHVRSQHDVCLELGQIGDLR